MLIISLDRGLGAYDKAVVRDEAGEIIGTLSQNGKTTANLPVKMQKIKTHTQEKAKAKGEDTYGYKKNMPTFWP